MQEAVIYGTYTVQIATNIDRRLLNNVVHNFRQRFEEIRRIDFRVEEYFRRKETFIANIDPIFL